MSLVRDVNSIGIRKMSPREALMAERAAEAAGEARREPKPERPSAFKNDQSFERLEARIAALEAKMAALEALDDRVAALEEARVSKRKSRVVQKMSGVRIEDEEA